MSYNGSGVFVINTSGQPVVTGTVISSTAFNALTADLGTGLSTAITKDGQTATTARIPFVAGLSSALVTDTTNGSTGSIFTAGGIGITKGLFVGGTATFSATPVFSALTASSAVATDASKNLVSVTNTGTGNNVLATSPTLVTPILGTPQSATLSNATGLPLSTGVTGTLPIANGGTSQTTATAAFNALAPAQTSNTGKYLTTDGTNSSWATVSVTPAGVSDQNNTSTGYFDLPAGTTAQRPGSPATGMIRYNTSQSSYEVYGGTIWQPVTTGLYTYSASLLVDAGGGGGGGNTAGGGGAGGLIVTTASLAVDIVYTITVGGGGAKAASAVANGTQGTNSEISGTGITTQTAIGGGYGAGYTGVAVNGGAGGSGGGATGGGAVGSATSGQGNVGGSSAGSGTSHAAGGGGGAGAVGGNAVANTVGGAGGNGTASSITGSSVTYAGGGGGGVYATSTQSAGGTGGGGTGGASLIAGANATANTGGGGGGGGASADAGNGGSGVVILSVPTANYSGTTTGSPTVTTSGANTIIKFTASGTYTA